MRISPLVRMSRSGSGKRAVAEVIGDGGLVDRLRVDLAGAGRARDAACRLDDVLAPAIADAQTDREARVGARQLDHLLELTPHRIGQARHVADGEHAHLILHQLAHFAAQVAQE
jgi:hypothetical protein